MPRRATSTRSTTARAPARPAAPTRPAQPPPPAHAPVPVHQQPSSMMMAPQPRGPGLMGQMAATAGGVAIGSVAGHAITGMLSGGNKAESAAEPAAAPAQTQAQQAHMRNPCAAYFEDFVHCTQTQSDISLCQGFNEALKECKTRYGVM